MTDALTKVAHKTSRAIMASALSLEAKFPAACRVLDEATALIFTGMGKSGFIAQKAAATFRSLGMPAHYVHPAEASHGDMGALAPGTAVIALSNSGETSELADLVRFCQVEGLPLLAITGPEDCTLARAATAALCYGRVEEACPNGLAPTTSTSVALVICDALAVHLASERRMTPADFKRLHPGGRLGASLRPVSALMRTPPVVGLKTPLLEAAAVMTGEVPGIALVVNRGIMQGVFTDGDLRRAIERKFTVVEQAMTKTPLVICETCCAEEAAEFMQAHRITKVLVEDALGSVVGVVTLHDCRC
jgi:arabinose-5-phosphate isomerase